ncbi:MAG: chromate transporter [Firmicutes bacterium]|nr:chromate transporter [Bacillota bacterium]
MGKIKEFFQNNIYAQLFTAFFKLGLFTFGGGMAMVPLLQDKVCKEYGWMTEDEVVDCLAVSQGLPGVIAINMATYTGYYKKGLKGALAASFGMILPSFIIIILVVCFLEEVSGNPYVDGALTGIKAAATGLIAYAAVKLGKQVLKTTFAWIVGIASFIIIAVIGVDAVWVILGGIVIGIGYSCTKMKKQKQAENKAEEEGAGGKLS